MTRSGHVATAAAGVVALLVGTGCGYDITGTPTGGSSVRGDVTEAGSGGLDRPSSAPAAPVDVPAEQAWALAELAPPEGAEVVSSVQRPNEQDVASYLVVSTTTAEAAAAFCDQTGGLLRTRGTPLVDQQRAPFDLTEDPEGIVGLCGGATNGEEYVVQRDVLVAESGGTTTVWLSVYEMPR